MRMFAALPVGGAMLIAALAGAPLRGQTSATLTVRAGEPGPVISRDIFGQFAEHLGEGIYGGVWVGPAIEDPQRPRHPQRRRGRAARDQGSGRPLARRVLREEYHWRGGIGPAARRPATVNGNWGNVVEPNAFGTHEFMDFIGQIGSEAFVTINVARAARRKRRTGWNI